MTAEVAASGTKHPVTEAFYVKDGTNTVSLAALAAGADGASLSFDAQNLDGTLFVSGMKVTAGAKSLALSNITVVILPATGPTRLDPLGGFHGQLVVKGVIGAHPEQRLGDSELERPQQAEDRVRSVRRHRRQRARRPGHPAARTSTASSRTPSLSFKLDLGEGKSSVGARRDRRQAGQRRGVAVTTLDLRNIDSTPAVACANALTRVNLADKARSDLLLTPTGDPAGDPTHPVRTVCAAPDPDGGRRGSGACVPTSYATSIMTWLNGE